MSPVGLHKLNRLVSRPGTRRLSCRWGETVSRRITKGPNPRSLALACRFLNKALRIHKRMARRDPHLFGPHARAYYRETLELEQFQHDLHAGLDKVYGPNPPGTPSTTVDVWTDRYEVQPAARNFRKWFNETYSRRRNF